MRNLTRGESMKKILLISVVTILMFAGATDLFAKELRIGFADKLKILFEYKKAKELNEALEKENEDAKVEFDKMAEGIKRLRDEMELLSESARREKGPELEKKLKELDNFRREKQQEIGRKYDEGIRSISKEISEVCERYGKNKGYDAILDARASLYVPESLDITDDILTELNK